MRIYKDQLYKLPAGFNSGISKTPRPPRYTMDELAKKVGLASYKDLTVLCMKHRMKFIEPVLTVGRRVKEPGASGGQPIAYYSLKDFKVWWIKVKELENKGKLAV